MNKEQLNAKMKEMKQQAGINAQKTKDSLGKVFGKENVSENLNKAKDGVNKVVNGAMNSNMVKKMSQGQKFAALGVAAFFLIVIIAFAGRFILTPEPSIWCVAEAPKTELAFNSAGKVAEVAYSAKQVVSKGDGIARIDETAYIAELNSAENSLMEANLKFLTMENRLADKENEVADLKLKAAESANKAAISAFELAREYEKQCRSFFSNDMIAETHYTESLRLVSNAQAEVEMTENALKNATQALETAKKGFTSEDITTAKQAAEVASKKVDTAKSALEGAYIVAPFNAYINNISIKVSDDVEQGKPVCEVVDLSKVWLRGLVNKAMTESVIPGSAVNVEFNEISNEMFAGKIISVTPEPVEQKDGEDLYELRIELDNPVSNVLPGMEAVAVVAAE